MYIMFLVNVSQFYDIYYFKLQLNVEQPSDISSISIAIPRRVGYLS